MSADGMIPTMGRAELGSAEPTEEGSSALQTSDLRLDPVSLMFTDRLNPRLGLAPSPNLILVLLQTQHRVTNRDRLIKLFH